MCRFNKGNENVKDENRSGRPSVDLDDEILLYLENHRFTTIGRMSQYMGVSDETIRKKLRRKQARHSEKLFVKIC